MRQNKTMKILMISIAKTIHQLTQLYFREYSEKLTDAIIYVYPKSNKRYFTDFNYPDSIPILNIILKETHISALPTEILLYILRWVVSSDLDLRSLEMFGQTCRGFYLCARDQEIWRSSCERYIHSS